MRIITNLQDCVGRLLITHSGRFHADDVFATVILYLAFNGNVSLLRTNNPPTRIPFPNTVYDVGYEQGYTRYDHHQRGGNGFRRNGIPYAAAGLIWRTFGTYVLTNYGIPEEHINNVWKQLDNIVIQPIDAWDNGHQLVQSSEFSISRIIADFNPTFLETKTSNQCFDEAFEYAKNVFIREIEKAKARVFATSLVEEAIENSQNRIMLLDKCVPWEGIVLRSESQKAKDLLYVISPSNRATGYVVIAVKKTTEIPEPRKPFPEAWGGLSSKTLQALTGIDTIHFCHTGGFIAGTTTLEDAKKLAEIAANYEEKILYLKEG